MGYLCTFVTQSGVKSGVKSLLQLPRDEAELIPHTTNWKWEEKPNVG